MISKKCNNYDCAIKIINAIKYHLCKEDEDYDKAILSPKFLSSYLDLMFVDGFENTIKELENDSN